MAGTTRLDIVIQGLQGGAGQGASGSSGQAADLKAAETAYKGIAASAERIAKAASSLEKSASASSGKSTGKSGEEKSRERTAQKEADALLRIWEKSLKDQISTASKAAAATIKVAEEAAKKRLNTESKLAESIIRVSESSAKSRISVEDKLWKSIISSVEHAIKKRTDVEAKAQESLIRTAESAAKKRQTVETNLANAFIRVSEDAAKKRADGIAKAFAAEIRLLEDAVKRRRAILQKAAESEIRIAEDAAKKRNGIIAKLAEAEIRIAEDAAKKRQASAAKVEDAITSEALHASKKRIDVAAAAERSLLDVATHAAKTRIDLEATMWRKIIGAVDRAVKRKEALLQKAAMDELDVAKYKAKALIDVERAQALSSIRIAEKSAKDKSTLELRTATAALNQKTKSAKDAEKAEKDSSDRSVKDAERAAARKRQLMATMARFTAEQAQAIIASELSISRSRADLQADVMMNMAGIRGPSDVIRFGTGTASSRMRQQAQEATTRGQTWGGGIGGTAGLVGGAILGGGPGAMVGSQVGESIGRAVGDSVTTQLANSKKILAGAVDSIGIIAGEIADMLASATKVAIGATLAGAIAAAMGALKREPIEQAFQEFSESLGDKPAAAMERFKTALAGTASEMEIMLAFNRAVSLGAIETTQQFEALAIAARKMAMATGRDVGDALNDIAVGLGRQSFRVLDNIGIVVRATEAYKEYAKQIGKNVKELTLEERRYAFTNAAMTDLIRKQGLLSNQTETHRARWDRFQASMANWKDRVGMKVLELFDRLEPSLRRLGAAIEKLFSRSGVQESIQGWIDKLTEWIDKASSYLENNSLEQIWEDAKAKAREFFDFVLERLRGLMESLPGFIEEMASMFEGLITQTIKPDEIAARLGGALSAVMSGIGGGVTAPRIIPGEASILQTGGLVWGENSRVKEDIESLKEPFRAVAKQIHDEMSPASGFVNAGSMNEMVAKINKAMLDLARNINETNERIAAASRPVSTATIERHVLKTPQASPSKKQTLGPPPSKGWSPNMFGQALDELGTLDNNFKQFILKRKEFLQKEQEALEAERKPLEARRARLERMASFIDKLPREVNTKTGQKVKAEDSPWNMLFDATGRAATAEAAGVQNTPDWQRISHDLDKLEEAAGEAEEALVEYARAMRAINDPDIIGTQGLVDATKGEIQLIEDILSSEAKVREKAKRDLDNSLEKLHAAHEKYNEAVEDAVGKRAAVEDEYNDAVRSAKKRHAAALEDASKRLVDAYEGILNNFKSRMAAATGEDAMPTKFKRAMARKKRLDDRWLRNEMNLEMSRGAIGAMGVGEMARDPMALANLEAKFAQRKMRAEAPLDIARDVTAATELAKGRLGADPDVIKAEGEKKNDVERINQDLKDTLAELESERDEAIAKIDKAVSDFKDGVDKATDVSKDLAKKQTEVMELTGKLIEENTKAMAEEKKKLEALEKRLDAMSDAFKKTSPARSKI